MLLQAPNIFWVEVDEVAGGWINSGKKKMCPGRSVGPDCSPEGPWWFCTSCHALV